MGDIFKYHTGVRLDVIRNEYGLAKEDILKIKSPVLEAVAQLNRAQQNVLVAYAELHSIEKTAEVFGVSPTAMAGYLKKIQKKLSYLNTYRREKERNRGKKGRGKNRPKQY
jgi:AraC-like DNA-binding protein